jgi:small subunit ribosomal protein S3
VGQKVNPHGLRIGIIKNWDARWYADKDFAKNLHEDIKIRKFTKSKLYSAGISRIEIERAANRLKVTIHVAKPGMVIGRGGTGIEELKKSLKLLTDKVVDVNIAEIKQAEMDATLVAENIAAQLEKRIAFRRAMKQSVGRTMRMGAKGIKVMVAGRLGGAEIARTESTREGSIPLHTLRADIDYGIAEAATTYGRIGVKVWIYKGEILPEVKQVNRTEERPEAKMDARPKAKPEVKAEVKPEVQAQPKVEVKAEPAVEVQPEIKVAPVSAEPEVKAEAQLDVEAAADADAKPKAKPRVKKAEAKTDEPDEESAAKQEAKPRAKKPAAANEGGEE